MPMATEPAPSASQRPWNYATARRRAVAWVVDAFVLLVLWYVQIGAFAALGWNRDAPAFFLAFTLVIILYGVLFIAVGATPGKRICGLRVVDWQQEQPGLARSLKRSVLPGVKWFALFYCLLRLGYDLETYGNLGFLFWLVIVFSLSFLTVYDLLPLRTSPFRQTGHDALASTFVLSSK